MKSTIWPTNELKSTQTYLGLELSNKGPIAKSSR
jgi:hypothetical protein